MEIYVKTNFLRISSMKLNQLRCFQMPQVVFIERELLRMTKVLMEDVDRKHLENQYRTKLTNILLQHENIDAEVVEISSNIEKQQQTMLSRSLIETDMILDPSFQSSIETRNKANG